MGVACTFSSLHQAHTAASTHDQIFKSYVHDESAILISISAQPGCFIK